MTQPNQAYLDAFPSPAWTYLNAFDPTLGRRIPGGIVLTIPERVLRLRQEQLVEWLQTSVFTRIPYREVDPAHGISNG